MTRKSVKQAKDRDTSLWGKTEWNNKRHGKGPPPDPNSKTSKQYSTPEARRKLILRRRKMRRKKRLKEIRWIKKWDVKWLSFILAVAETRSKMMRLTDSRRENFCRLCVSGSTITDAYENAGYARNDGNASKLYNNIQIQARIRELALEKAEGIIKPVDDILKNQITNQEDLELTKTWVLENLMLLVQSAKLSGQASAAFRCIELMGEYLGMWGKTGSGKGAEAVDKKTRPSKDMKKLADLVKTFRVMDEEKARRARDEVDNNAGTEVDTEFAEQSEDSGDGVGGEFDEEDDTTS